MRGERKQRIEENSGNGSFVGFSPRSGILQLWTERPLHINEPAVQRRGPGPYMSFNAFSVI